MSWSETLLDASYRGVPLGVMAESMEGERRLAQHGVPYRDGDDVEDLGRKARPFSFTVVVFGTNYEIELQKLLAALDTPGPGELIHPIYGRLDVLARRWKVDLHRRTSRLRAGRNPVPGAYALRAVLCPAI